MDGVMEGEGSAPLPADALLRRAGRQGLPESQRQAWHVLPPTRRDLAARRLTALLRWLDPSPDEVPFTSAAEAASAAGMGLSNFYAMSKRWADSKSIDSLGLHVSRTRPRGSEVARHVERARWLLIAHLTADPGASEADLIRLLHDRIASPLSRTSLQRLVREARRALPANSPFGTAIVFDSAGMDMVDERGRRLRFNAAVDDGTGTVLGWALGFEAEILLAYEKAVDFALSRMHGTSEGTPFSRRPPLLLDPDLRRVALADRPPAIEVRLSPESQLAHLAPTPAEPQVRWVETLLGRSIVAALGDSVGGIRIGTGTRSDGRGYRSGRTAEFPIRTGQLLQRIGRDVALTNRRRLAVARREAEPWEEEALNPLRRSLRQCGNSLFLTHNRSDPDTDTPRR